MVKVASIKKTIKALSISLNFFSVYTTCGTLTTFWMRIVSGRHSASMCSVSYKRFICTLTPFLSILMVSYCLSTKVSCMALISVTMVVSTFTATESSIVGSFAIARFRCHLAPHPWVKKSSPTIRTALIIPLTHLRTTGFTFFLVIKVATRLLLVG